MRNRIIGRCVAIAAGAAFLVPALAGTAAAESASGACAGGGKAATFSTDYTISGSSDIVTRFNWNIQGASLGNQNNVEARLKYDKLGSDPILYTYISPDSIRPGKGYHVLNPATRAQRGKKAYTEYKFVFDVFAANDPSCSGHTQYF